MKKKKSQFPHSVEKQLRFILSTNSSKLIKRYKEVLKKDKNAEFEEVEFSNAEKKKIINDLTKVAIATNKHVFESWRTLTDDELKMTDLKGAKYWIRENYLRVKNMNKTFAEKMTVIRDDKYRELLKTFNGSLDFRFDKLANGRITNADIDKLLTQLKANYNPNSEIKTLIEKLEKTRNLKSEEIKTLQSWANRRNELWARNETGNICASQLQDLWLENGIEKYIWRTEQDSRVRLEHMEKEGKIFEVGVGIMPMEEFGCRCWAEPIRAKKEDKNGD
ncbi:MAG: minor capsid protein [Fusobacterium gastrosuis]|uniref:minor capsid protein n=1 Tax=Fusobacterium gastrosuis TaxID=1755100 RepID=UPI002A869F7C|nr:minor capsid protein [Fusobacterium gastrosuis]